MPLDRRPVLMPVEGIDRSKPASFIDDRAGFPKNMRFNSYELQKRPGKSKYGSSQTADTTQIIGYGVFEDSQLNKYLIRASKAKVEKYNTSTGDWESISVSDLSGGDDDFMFFASIPQSDMIVFTNGVNVIRKWTGSGNNVALGGSPSKAKYLCYLSPYLILGYLTEGGTPYPTKVGWCDTGDPEEWTSGNAGSELLADEPSPIKNIVKLNEYAAVYKRNSLYLGRKVSTSDVLDFSMFRSGIGLVAPRAVADVFGTHYFMGHTNFWAWDGANLTPIGNKVRDRVFTTLDKTNVTRCFAQHVRYLNEVWFFTVPSGHSWPTQVWKYNYRYGLWFHDECDELTAAIEWIRTASLTWGDLTGTWAEQLFSWGDATISENFEEIALGDSGGYSYKVDYLTTNDDGTIVTAEQQTKDFVADKLEYHKRWLQFDIWAKGSGTMKVYYSTDEGSSWTNIPFDPDNVGATLSLDYEKFEFYLDVVARKIRFKMIEETDDGMIYIRNYYPYFLQREEIRS